MAAVYFWPVATLRTGPSPFDGFHPHRPPESPRQDDARPGPHHRQQCAGHAARGAHGPARGRRGPARRARLHRAGQGEGAGPGGGRLAEPRPGAGVGRAQGTRGDHGRGCGRHQPCRPAARRHPDGRPAGRRQDDDDRQARQAPDRKAQEEGADRLGRRLPSGRHRAAQDRDAPGRRRVVRIHARTEAARYRAGGAGLRQAPLPRRAAGRHRRPAGDRRGLDGRDQGPACGAPPGRDAVRRRRDAGPGRGQHGQGFQGGAAADWRDPDQARRRLARRRGPVGAPDHRRADQVRRRVREDRRPGGLRCRAPCRPRAGHGRHRRPGGTGHAERRPGLGPGHGRKAQERQRFRPERLPAADRADEEDGRSGWPDGQAAAEHDGWQAAGPGRHGPGRARHEAHGGHPARNDRQGARPPRAADGRQEQGLAKEAHRGGRRRADSGGQPAAESVRPDAADDEEDEGRWADEDDEAHGRAQGFARHALTLPLTATNKRTHLPPCLKGVCPCPGCDSGASVARHAETSFPPCRRRLAQPHDRTDRRPGQHARGHRGALAADTGAAACQRGTPSTQMSGRGARAGASQGLSVGPCPTAQAAARAGTTFLPGVAVAHRPVDGRLRTLR
mmetsp:Transcript_6764/g.28394  ORF Transcript_6764/g.28394 Transcript_6764/m.28394 type:complete len:618 (-) Transcript_6764:80-1933(-)